MSGETTVAGRPPATTVHRARLAGLLTATMAFSTLLQFGVGSLGPTLTSDLHLSRAGLGVIIATYYLTGGVLARPLGRWIDGVRSRFALRMTFIVAAVALGAFAAIDSYPLILLAMIPAGIAAASGNPVTNRVVAAMPEPRGTVMAVKQAGVPVGSLLAGLVLPPLAEAIGWRATILCACGACLAALAATGWAPEGRPAARRKLEGSAAKAPASVKVLAVFGFCMGAGTATLTTYLPLYGEHRLDMTRTAAGALLAVVGVCGITARIVWTRRFERHAAAGGSPSILVALAATALCSVGVVAAAAAVGTWLLWLGCVLVGVSATAWNAIVMLIVIQRAPPGTTARASGLVVMAFYFGMGIGAPVFGLTVDASNYYIGWAITAATFVGAILAAGALLRSGQREAVVEPVGFVP